MGSLANEIVKKYAMWFYPKALGFSPSQRWGHSSCYSHGCVYVFGGCCGGIHFSDVLTLNLGTMAWNTLATSGQGPGPRDSHSAVLVGRRMFVFGGTNGSKKVNDLHVLYLDTKKWIIPVCRGTPPSPRESHTATLVGDDKLIIFGGSGEGEANYLNDLHILDLKTMSWSSPEVKGDVPVPRDSHSAVAVGNKLFVYGGDRGDKYHCDFDVLDINTMTWTKLLVQGASPGARAGHASVNIGMKIYIIGGVGDKQYYNDVWFLDLSKHTWNKMDVRGQQPQGRFSHTIVVAGSDIVVFGGCGEDEHPLNQLLVLQLEAEHPNSSNNVSRSYLNLVKTRLPRGTENNSRSIFLANKEVSRTEDCELELELLSKQSCRFILDSPHQKKRRIVNSMELETGSEQEHSLSHSQRSSPSQSDLEETPAAKVVDCLVTSEGYNLYKQTSQILRNGQSHEVARSLEDKQNTVKILPNNLQKFNDCHKPEKSVHSTDSSSQGLNFPLVYHQKQLKTRSTQNMIGAEVRGKVDGAFDSGLLMTATVNGKIFRGVLFTPTLGIESRGAIASQNPPPQAIQVPVVHSFPSINHREHTASSEQPTIYPTAEVSQRFWHAQLPGKHPATRAAAAPSLTKEHKPQSDLQGVVLTLGGLGNDHVG